MKVLFAVLLAVSMPASAKMLAYIPTPEQPSVVLTDNLEPDICGGFNPPFIALTIDLKAGTYTVGCYEWLTGDDGKLTAAVYWSDAKDVAYYPESMFKKVP